MQIFLPMASFLVISQSTELSADLNSDFLCHI